MNIMNIPQTTLNHPIGILYSPRLNSAGLKESLATVTRSIMGIMYEVYRPVAVSENNAAKASLFHNPGKHNTNAQKILNHIARAGLPV